MMSPGTEVNESMQTGQRRDTPLEPSPHANDEKQNLFLNADTDFDLNEPWGDNIERKSFHSIRLYFQNVHGLKPSANWYKWCDALSALHKHRVDIIGFAETNVNWNPILTR